MHVLIDMTDVVNGEDRVLTTKQLAQYLGISTRSLERFRVDGSGPKFVKLGADKLRARVVYRWSDVQAWLGSNTFGSTAELDSPNR